MTIGDPPWDAEIDWWHPTSLSEPFRWPSIYIDPPPLFGEAIEYVPTLIPGNVVVYGRHDWPSFSWWMIPGTHDD